jgi:hypothetical protein
MTKKKRYGFLLKKIILIRKLELLFFIIICIFIFISISTSQPNILLETTNLLLFIIIYNY